MSEKDLKEKVEEILEDAVEKIIEAIKEEKNTNNPIWNKE